MNRDVDVHGLACSAVLEMFNMFFLCRFSLVVSSASGLNKENVVLTVEGLFNALSHFDDRH